MDCPEKVASGFVITSGDGAVLLQLVEKVINQVTRLVKVPVIIARLFTATARGDDNALASDFQRCDDPLLGVISFIDEDRACLRVRQQYVSPFEIVGLPRREMKAGRIAQSVGGGVNLGAQTAPATPDCLCFRALFFAPALC
jgi:hypothetical protein